MNHPNPHARYFRSRSILANLLIFFLVFPGFLFAEVRRLEIDSTQIILNGKSFGAAGRYELVYGKVFFSFDPANPYNRRIVGLALAPRNAEGNVEAWANFVVLKPTESQKGRDIALIEVSNRGGKFSLRYFNRATSRTLNPSNPSSFGDELLMRQGLTIIWVGWQFDVPERPGVLRLHVPRARNGDGTPIIGLVRSDWTIDQDTKVLLISHRNHIPYPVLRFDDPRIQLTERDGRDAPRRVVSRDKWQFAIQKDGKIIPDSTHIYMATGFKAGKIYELVYPAKDPAVVGLGLAAIRDIISYVKYDPTCPFPAKRGIAAGVSQTGRFLRHFIYQGFNTDEHGRMAYDGLMIMTAGAGRGSFNHRFAQPSRDAHRYSAFFYPTDIFPFTSKVQFDSLQWRSDGLFAHQFNPANLPKIFYINTGYEYWGRAAGLIHVSVDGKKDIPPFPNERIYHLASGQHFVGGFPPNERNKIADTPAYRGNPLDFSVNYRALLIKLISWVEGKSQPPESRYPQIATNLLVRLNEVNFPKIPGIQFPHVNHVAYRVDYGPRWSEGIVDFQPPVIGTPFPALVPQVDRFGNELGGVRNVELLVPLATYTPWNLRINYPAAQNELTDFRGTYIPFPRSPAQKSALHDPRPAITQLYKNKKDFLEKVKMAAAKLVAEGFLLPEDVSYVVKRNERYWNFIMEEN